jgi:hypothetical protein
VGIVDRLGNVSRPVSTGDVAAKLRIDYSRGVKDHTTKSLESACNLCWQLEKTRLNIDGFIHEAADLISRLFSIESVAIGVWDRKARLYKYRDIVGLEQDVVDGFKQLSYTKDELLNPEKYPCHEISSHTKLFLSEEHPYAEGEEFTYRRPALIGMTRRSITDSLEADYLDIFFYGHDNEILGFIEISGTRLRKLPDAGTIRWIELIAGIVGMAVQRHEAMT